MIKLFNYLTLFCCTLLGLVPLTSQAGTIQIMAFGDSITQGVNYIMSPGAGRRVGGYEPQLEYLFSLVGRSASVYNWGLGGETTQQALDGGKIHCEVDPVTGEETCGFVPSRTLGSALTQQGFANYFLVMEGTNDVFSGISPYQTATNIGIMIDQARSFGMMPIVGTITPDFRGIEGKDIEYRNSLIRQKAAEKGATLVDQYNGLVGNWGAYVSSDNLHPNDYGYKAMAMVWFKPFYNLQLTTGTAVAHQNSPESVVAVLNGSATANGEVFGMAFQYGLDTSMDNSVQATPTRGEASGGLSVTAEIEGLQFETQYYYQMISTLDGMTFKGDMKTFTTPKRLVNLSWLMLLLKADEEIIIPEELL